MSQGDEALVGGVPSHWDGVQTRFVFTNTHNDDGDGDYHSNVADGSKL